MDNYKRFDYFDTPIRNVSIFDDYADPEQYGIPPLDVYEFIYKMEKDRKLWFEKKQLYKDWDGILLILITLLIFVLAYLMQFLISHYLNDIGYPKGLSYIIYLLAFILVYYLWKDSFFIRMYKIWIENKYKQKTQNNPQIEFFLEIVNYKYYKKQNNQPESWLNV